MQDIATRSSDAARLWQQGDDALAAGQAEQAYRLYTEAHDLVTDCPKLHLRAHHQLRRVTRARDPRGEYLTDTLLVALAPLGVFELIAVFFRSRVARTVECRRS
ncbi:hypothetical protein [Solimonas sp. K1W22B-7]|uniref:hypothetical protein n=1 Tax=Solimonas sp. K1W22B-7 TaxID=2303331 RepID=UPI0013C3EA84|nr:hypothetical protein [Solimonas sp. K1W22B-7]